jgi:hypothetical protein
MNVGNRHGNLHVANEVSYNPIRILDRMDGSPNPEYYTVILYVMVAR